MYNNQAISSLSREELIKALQKFQLKSGPITRTTRRIFENRLKAYLETNSSQNESKENKENRIVVDKQHYKECSVNKNNKNDHNSEIKIVNSKNNDIAHDVNNFGRVQIMENDVMDSEGDFTHNAVLQNDVQTSGIVFKHDVKVISDIQTQQVNVYSYKISHEITLPNEDSKASEKDILVDQNNEIVVETVSQSFSETQAESDSTNINETLEHETSKNTIKETTKCTSHQDANKSTPCFYAVWIPYSSTRVNGNIPIIFESQQEALNKMKSFKGSRFKVFESKEEAEHFSLSKSINSCESVPPVHSLQSQKFIPEPKEKEKIVKVPTFHELIKFRQHIEKFKIDEVEACLTHPRYLISGSDIPVILQEGSRMNAVHIGIKCNCVRVLKGIFKKIQSDEFLRIVYPNTSDVHLQFRRNHLMDLYLNTPEKILCDTPLHMACKLGLTHIVRYLLTFKQIKVDAKNKECQTCVDVICGRISNRPAAEREKIKAEIILLFTEKTYVPLYGDKDGLQSKIGLPIITLSPNDLLSTSTNVKAYAGPMSPEQANIVFGKWKKSPRDRMYSVTACSDYEKGMERIGRSIALSEKVPFNEYWSFLNRYTNLASTKGLKKLEKYLKSKYKESNQNCELENCVSNGMTSLTTTKKYRQRIESYDNDKNPVDIKRKLLFDEGKLSLEDVECKMDDEHITPTHHNLDGSESELISQKDNQQLMNNDENAPADSKENRLTMQDKSMLILDEKLSLQNENIHTKLKNDITDNLLELKIDDTAPNLNRAKDTDGIGPENVRTCKDKNIFKFIERKLISNRCSPLRCLCDINISEECYLSESFNRLSLDCSIQEVNTSTLVDKNNMNMDLANQSPSFHIGYTSGIYSSLNVNPLDKKSQGESLGENLNQLESIDNDRYENRKSCHDTDDGKEALSDSFTDCSLPFIDSSFNSPIDSSSTFNSPDPNLSSLGNKKILVGKSDNSSHVNCYPEQHVFIDGNKPSKHDLDVLRVISESTEIDNFPHIRRWKCLVESFSDETKSSWPSPGSPRYKKTVSRRSGWTL